ncbi:MFS transporter [Actinophytocola sp.]|uniref:MFS transporter n=1 Tax=Actinophytocola sp. TaxID=1872138 RepID=UPI003D6C0692
MSHSARLADYRAALTTPGAGVPALMSLLARMPIAMIGLSLLLYVQRETGSFAIAGLVSAGSLVGVAVGAVIQGRIMDRRGPTGPLVATVGLFVVAVVGVLIAVESGQSTAVIVLLGAVVGLTEPMVGSASRALWAHLVPAGPLRHAAYAYEAISLEVFFILGPALAGLLVAAPWAGTGVVVGAACMAVGGIGFAYSKAVRAVRPDREARDLLGALASPGMRTVALAALGFGVTVGFVEVAVPAAATKAGHAPLGGLLLAVWSLSSVVFGLWYATRPWPREMRLRLPALLGAFALLIAPLSLLTSLAALAVGLLVAGVFITPQSTAHSTAIELVAPHGTATEAFGWVVTAVTLGLAAGQSASGYLVEHVGVPVSFLAASVSGLLIATLVWARRATVTTYAPAPDPVAVAAR